MHLQHVGENKPHSELHADSSILPWNFILDGYDKATLTVVHGKTCNISNIVYISPTPN